MTIISYLLLAMILIFSHKAHALRRGEVFDYTPSYFLYPIPGKIPGLGSAFGIGATYNNIAGSDVDVTGAHLSGDFDVTILTMLNLHLLEESLLLDAGIFKYDVASLTYDRGPDTTKNDYILPHVEGKGYYSQLTFLSIERLFELYYRIKKQDYKVHSVRDKDGNAFSNIDNSKKSSTNHQVGAVLDITDHRYDPRFGLKLEYLFTKPENNDSTQSSFYIEDISLKFYLPIGRNSTWAFNYFQSDAHITNKASVDENQLKSDIGLNCESIPDSLSSEKSTCLEIENQRIQERIAFNTYGRATSMGGSQRLRSYDNGRFSAGHTRFLGSEFRWNFNTEKKPFDIFIMKGIRTGLQLAFFGGLGAFADKKEDLNYKYHSLGAGARMVFQGGTVFRADFATGTEGSRTTLFIDYPWSLSPIDNSGQ